MNLDKIKEVQAARTLPQDEAWAILSPMLDRLRVDWRVVETRDDGLSLIHRYRRRIVVSVARELDGKRWIHASISHPNRIPDYDDLFELKEAVFGPAGKAVMVFPPRDQHVNIHPRCLYLFGCVDGDPLPDFTHGTGSL